MEKKFFSIEDAKRLEELRKDEALKKAKEKKAEGLFTAGVILVLGLELAFGGSVSIAATFAGFTAGILLCLYAPLGGFNAR